MHFPCEMKTGALNGGESYGQSNVTDVLQAAN